MTQKELHTSVIEKISQGKLIEAVNTLLDFFEGNQPDWLVKIAGRIHALTRKEKAGELSNEDEVLNHNKIRSALLSALNEYFGEEAKSQQDEGKTTNSQESSKHTSHIHIEGTNVVNQTGDIDNQTFNFNN